MFHDSLLVWKASLVIFMVFQAADAKATVKIYLGTFTAPYYVKCDVFGPCDFKFKFCVDRLNSGRRIEPCTYLSKTTSALGRSPINLGTVSPLIVPINHWEGGLNLKVQALDYDRFSKDDVVDNLWTSYLSPTIGTSSTKTMQSRTKLTVTFTSSCDPNYFGSYCDTVCIPKANDKEGYFKCDSITGKKVCLPDWKGEGCLESKYSTSTSTSHAPITPEVDTSTSSSFQEVESTEPSDNDNSIQTTTSFSTEDTKIYDVTIVTTPIEDIDRYFESETNSSSNSSKVPLQWFCGTSILGSMDDNETKADDEFSLFIAKMLNSLSEYENSTLIFNSNRSRICNGSEVFALILEYCLLGTYEDQWKMEELIKKEYIQILNPELNLNNEDCEDESHNDRATADQFQSKKVIWGVATSLAILVLVLGLFLYYWSRHYERRKRAAGSSTIDCRLSYKSHLCTNNHNSNDDATLISVNSERHLSVENINCPKDNFQSDNNALS